MQHDTLEDRMMQLEDQSVVDTFFGAATLDANRAVSLTMAA